MMRACSSAALAETVGSISTLRRCTLWGTGTVFGTLYRFAFAVYVSSVVGTLRLGLLLLLLIWLL